MKIKNPRNILKYQAKDITSLSLKQAAILIVGIALFFGVGIILYFVSCPIIIAFFISMIISMPFVLSAFLKISGLPFDEVLKRIIKSVLYNRDYRPYKTGGFKDE